MVQARELRVGNLVEYTENNYGCVLKIDSQSMYDNLYLECTESFEWTEFDKVNPVPLTPKILETFGAKSEGGDFILRVGALKMKLRYTTEWYCELGDIYLAVTIQCLHQLQNLYFVLTNRELEINL